MTEHALQGTQAGTGRGQAGPTDCQWKRRPQSLMLSGGEQQAESNGPVTGTAGRTG